jgi:hypothetical protein
MEYKDFFEAETSRCILKKDYKDMNPLDKVFIIWKSKIHIREKFSLLRDLKKIESDFNLKKYLPNQPYESFLKFLEDFFDVYEIIRHVWLRLPKYTYVIIKSNGKIITNNKSFESITECKNAMIYNWDGSENCSFKIYADCKFEYKEHIVANYYTVNNDCILTNLAYAKPVNCDKYNNVYKVFSDYIIKNNI